MIKIIYIIALTPLVVPLIILGSILGVISECCEMLVDKLIRQKDSL